MVDRLELRFWRIVRRIVRRQEGVKEGIMRNGFMETGLDVGGWFRDGICEGFVW